MIATVTQTVVLHHQRDTEIDLLQPHEVELQPKHVKGNLPLEGATKDTFLDDEAGRLKP